MVKHKIVRVKDLQRCLNLKHIRYYSAPADSSIPANKTKYIPTSGTYPQGFRVSATHVGVKSTNTSRPDLALIVSDVPSSAAAVFTKNAFQAAPVQVSRKILEEQGYRGIRSVIINSGCANAVTGSGGLQDANAMAKAASEAVTGTDEPQSIVMSTGVIGQRLPIQRILGKVSEAYGNLDDTHEAWLATAKAICTTDTFPKLISETFTLPGEAHNGVEYRIAGMTKGAGMINPNMGTLLGVICTDVKIDPDSIRDFIRTATESTFNAITIDGDTSTNDTLALLANGAAAKSEHAILKKQGNATSQAFIEVLTSFMAKLAKLVVRDGEGATKFIEIRIRNARSKADAMSIAASIANSALVKTALYGKDANWGRILCAIGYAQPALRDPLNHDDRYSPFDPMKVSVSFIPAEHSASKNEGVLHLLVKGEPETVDEARAARLLEDEDLIIDVDLAAGDANGTYWTCDFSHEYVTINGDYRT